MLEVLSNAVDEVMAVDGYDTQSIVELQRQINRLSAAHARMVRQWDASCTWADDGSKSAAHRLARETATSVTHARQCVKRANRLGIMDDTTAAFESGSVSLDQVDLLVQANQPELAAQFQRDEALLLNSVQGLRHVDATKAVTYWIQCADEALSESKAQQQLKARSASASTTFEGTVDLRALFDAIGGAVFTNELDSIERELFEADWAHDKLTEAEVPSRTATQRRCDALVEMARRSSCYSPGGHESTTPALISVLVDYPTFSRVCELSNGLVVTPGQVATLLEQADIERIVFDSPARVMEVSRKRNFSGAARRAVQVRDRHCQHRSGCDEPIDRCDVDHVWPWSQGGLTEQTNGQLLCGVHNRAKGSGPP